jgi:hypothetical protein
MKQFISYLATALLFAAMLGSCAKDTSSPQQVSQEILGKIAALGFSTENVQVLEDGYLVENDIVLHDHDLDVVPSHPSLVIAEEEQYHTFETVDIPGSSRTITVSMSGNYNSNMSSALDVAIGRYNAVANCDLDFLRVSSNGNINVKTVNGGSFIASAGFPSGGNPYPEVRFNRQYRNWNNNTLATVFAHEIGHCIGYRHTDWMNRSYSCGTGGSEGQQNDGVGAVHIPGTPTDPEAGSWMLACIGNGTNRPFTDNDKTALTYLY